MRSITFLLFSLLLFTSCNNQFDIVQDVTDRLNIIDNSVNGYWEYYITENADSLIFYSDKECTSRQPLLYPRRVKIKQTVCTNNGYDLEYNTYYTTLTIPAGTVAYEIWHGYNYECYCNSDPYNINLTDNEVLIPHVPDVSFQ